MVRGLAQALIILLVLAPAVFFVAPLPWEYDQVQPYLCWTVIASGITIVAFIIYAAAWNKDPSDPGSW